MKRRHFVLSTVAVSSTITAGCLGEETTQNEDNEPEDEDVNGKYDIEQNPERDSNESTEEESEDADEDEYDTDELDSNYALMTESMDIIEISQSMLRVDFISFLKYIGPTTDVGLKPDDAEEVSDIVINVYESIRDGEGWEYEEPPEARMRNQGYRRYNVETGEWEMDESRGVSGGVCSRPKIQFDSGQKRVASKTLPPMEERDRENRVLNGEEQTGSVAEVLEFNLENRPPKMEPFAYLFEVKIPGDEALPRTDDQYITSTQQILYDGERFIYPDWTEERPHDIIMGVDKPKFEKYDPSTVYATSVNNFNKEQSSVYGTATVEHKRLSRYSHLNKEKHREILETRFDIDDAESGDDFRDHNAHPFDAPTYFDADILNLWGIEYEVAKEEYMNSKNAVGRVVDLSGDSSDNGRDRIQRILDKPDVLHAPAVERVARKLNTVCDQIGATSEAERVRVVADFVQYLKYDAGQFSESVRTGIDFLDADESYNNGTSTPTETLVHNYGDCGDYSVLMYALLTSNSFGYEAFIPVYTIGSSQNTNSLHTGVAVNYDELHVGSDWESAHESGVNYDPMEINEEYGGDSYIYIESTAPNRLGEVPYNTNTARIFTQRMDELMADYV
ncbi:transglutaminase domain-containing protein [Halobacteriaceae bacterium SHR40]|uniref:transglutaminase-like domain-containing protein n=1 Tax=Halovenus amylolytica TaxID=2500550 RepID=UPI000FE3B0B6